MYIVSRLEIKGGFGHRNLDYANASNSNSYGGTKNGHIIKVPIVYPMTEGGPMQFILLFMRKIQNIKRCR